MVPGKLTLVLPPYFFGAHDFHVRDQLHFASRSDIVFVGGFPHLPNVDAALFIAKQVMPLVWREEPTARLVLVGYAPPEEVRALANAEILVTGQVPDLEPYMNEARVFLPSPFWCRRQGQDCSGFAVRRSGCHHRSGGRGYRYRVRPQWDNSGEPGGSCRSRGITLSRRRAVRRVECCGCAAC